ncbi:MAG: DUF3823 domain-containing protein [Muribaculum sp.]|nr:DUF3823 domain-containing protein [Muribaculum sp.]
MNKIIYNLIIAIFALSTTACMEVDNFDEPEARYSGKIIDVTTGQPILASQGECKIRLWEMSHNLNPAPQDIPLKQDGTFKNTKLFNGTYDVQPRGAWWPVEKHRVPIGRKTQDDIIEVTPYLHIIDFEMEYDAERNELVVSCRLEAPITENLPNIRSVRPFLSLNQFCGSNNCIGEYSNNNAYKADMNTRWDRIPKADDGNSQPYEFRLPVKKGYYYFVRMGAYVDDEFHNYNYSEIKEIEIPME